MESNSRKESNLSNNNNTNENNEPIEEYVEKKEIKLENDYNKNNNSNTEELSKIKSCINIIRKMPVSKYKKSIEAVTNLIYEEDDLLNEFLQKIDQPADVFEDKSSVFLTCEFNRDGDYYRSNVTNTYFPKPEDKEEELSLRYPSKELREFEVKVNKAFSEYTKQYYGSTALCSCFVWELEQSNTNTPSYENGFCIGVVIKNQIKNTKNVDGGCWDSSNLVVVKFDHNKDNKLTATYTLTTTVMFNVGLNNKNLGDVAFSGSNTKMVRI